MCGIVGCVGSREAQPFLLKGLVALEYRGYDSAGLAVVDPEGSLRLLKRSGRVSALIEAAEKEKQQREEAKEKGKEFGKKALDFLEKQSDIEDAEIAAAKAKAAEKAKAKD